MLRHADPRLTANVYTRVDLADLRGDVDAYRHARERHRNAAQTESAAQDWPFVVEAGDRAAAPSDVAAVGERRQLADEGHHQQRLPKHVDTPLGVHARHLRPGEVAVDEAADFSRAASVEEERLAAAGGVLQQRLQAEVVPLGRLEIPAYLDGGRELAGLRGFGEDAHLRAALLRDQLFDIADLHAGESRERVGRGGLRSGRARDDADAVAVLPVFDARRQRDEVGELVAQLAADGVAGALVDVAGAGGAEGGEVEEVARPGEERRQGRAENARDLGVDENAEPGGGQERGLRRAAQPAREGER